MYPAPDTPGQSPIHVRMIHKDRRPPRACTDPSHSIRLREKLEVFRSKTSHDTMIGDLQKEGNVLVLIS